VKVPDFTGLSYPDAIALGEDSELLVELSHDNEPPRSRVGRPLGVVVDQDPALGAEVEPKTWVLISLHEGPGAGGVRDPRWPKPEPNTGRALAATDE
jgi:beta-lactam-binding protein with PASTA domain